MNATHPAVGRPMLPDRLRQFMDDLLPWYDRVAQARRDQRTERLNAQSDAALKHAERVIASREPDRIRRGYRATGDVFQRR